MVELASIALGAVVTLAITHREQITRENITVASNPDRIRGELQRAKNGALRGLGRGLKRIGRAFSRAGRHCEDASRWWTDTTVLPTLDLSRNRSENENESLDPLWSEVGETEDTDCVPKVGQDLEEDGVSGLFETDETDVEPGQGDGEKEQVVAPAEKNT